MQMDTCMQCLLCTCRALVKIMAFEIEQLAPKRIFDDDIREGKGLACSRLSVSVNRAGSKICSTLSFQVLFCRGPAEDGFEMYRDL